MVDQAETLRQVFSPQRLLGRQDGGGARLLSITSGKGGVGKTTLAVNLGILLCRMGKRVLLLDGDLGLANVDVLLGLRPERTLYHVVEGKATLADILLEGPEGLSVLPGANGIPEMSDLNGDGSNNLLRDLTELDQVYDFVLVDTAAGIHRSTFAFALAADEVLLLTTPEPTAVTDAYAVVKLLFQNGRPRAVRLLMNMVRDRKEGERWTDRLLGVVEQFQGRPLESWGSLSHDSSVMQSIRTQTPFVLRTPSSKLSSQLREVALKLTEGSVDVELKRGWRAFLSRVLTGELKKS